jgi:hypothetical protein
VIGKYAPDSVIGMIGGGGGGGAVMAGAPAGGGGGGISMAEVAKHNSKSDCWVAWFKFGWCWHFLARAVGTNPLQESSVRGSMLLCFSGPWSLALKISRVWSLEDNPDKVHKCFGHMKLFSCANGEPSAHPQSAQPDRAQVVVDGQVHHRDLWELRMTHTIPANHGTGHSGFFWGK